MTDKYKEILDALIKEGFNLLPGDNPAGTRDYDFKITPYSLNTKLSFKFDNIDHFVEFLKRSHPQSDQRVRVLHTTFIELNLDPTEFFWVNFFDKAPEKEA